MFLANNREEVDKTVDLHYYKEAHSSPTEVLSMRRVAQFFFVSSAQLQADWPEALGPCPDASELRLPRR